MSRPTATCNTNASVSAVVLMTSDLYRSLCVGADELPRGMDADQCKNYVLALPFMKCVSDKTTTDPYADIVVPEGSSFGGMDALTGKPSIGQQINVAICGLTDASNLPWVKKQHQQLNQAPSAAEEGHE